MPLRCLLGSGLFKLWSVFRCKILSVVYGVSMEARQLLILAGGRGTRLGAETADTPKPLVKLFDDTTMLDMLLSRYADLFEDVIILAGHLSAQVEAHIDERYKYSHPHVRVLSELVPLGTAGPLLLHESELKEAFFVMNGDTWFGIELENLIFKNEETLVSIALAKVEDVNRYGSVILDKRDRIVSFSEKNSNDLSESGYINAGIYLVKKHLLSAISSVPCSLERDIFPVLSDKLMLEGVVLDGDFIDVGVPETLAFARENRSFFIL